MLQISTSMLRAAPIAFRRRQNYAARSVSRPSPEVLSFKFDAKDEPEGDFRKSLFTYLGIALKYQWLILTFCGVGLVIGYIVNFTSTPIYRATATIQIDRQAPRIVKIEGARDQDSYGDDFRFYQTQYDLLRSRSLAERVAADLNLGAASDFLNPPSTSAWGKLRSLIFRSGVSKPTTRGISGSGKLQRLAWFNLVYQSNQRKIQSGEDFV